MKYRHLRFPGGLWKALTFSYDDGVIFDKRLAEVFDSYGVKATFNISSNMIGSNPKWHLSKEEIQQYILDRGHEVASHGADHTAPGMLRPFEGIQEYLFGRMDLEEMFDITVRGLAYPNSGITRMGNGADKEDIKHYLKDLGVAYARTLRGDNNGFNMPSDWLEWMPTMHHDNPEAINWAKQFVDIKPSTYFPANTPKLCYIWGHSFEFHRKDNWQRMNDLLDILARQEDIWYATNIEIFEYVEAYDRLLFTANSKKVYNPTLIDVWFEQEEKLYCIKSGETVELA